MSPPSPNGSAIERLLAVMARLRDPDGGCPWDLQQTYASIAPYTIEEAYEVADAIDAGDMEQLRDELGDLLLQVAFHAQMAKEHGHFAFDDVAAGIADKMIDRHPHVFAGAHIDSAAAQTVAWEEQKARERAARSTAEGPAPSALDGVAGNLPALTRAAKLQRRAARVGFDWPAPDPIFDKIAEEADELKAAVVTAPTSPAVAEELGDLLFSVVNLARALEVDPEQALRAANRKFERRFRRLETMAAGNGADLHGADLEALDRLWDEVKAEERRQAKSQSADG